MIISAGHTSDKWTVLNYFFQVEMTENPWFSFSDAVSLMSLRVEVRKLYWTVKPNKLFRIAVNSLTWAP